MSKVKFIFNKEKDLFNLWQTCSARSYGRDFSKNLPELIVNYCKNKSYNRCKKFLEQKHSAIYSSGYIEIFVIAVNKSWKLVEKEYFKRLEKITGKKLKAKTIRAYSTLAGRCPYDPKESSFMFNFFSSIPSVLATAGHEIFHLHFHENYFKDVEKVLGNRKTHDLKEALTVLLNLEFKDLWFILDKGYDSHKELRVFIEEQWKQDKNFNNLINNCIDYMKKEIESVK